MAASESPKTEQIITEFFSKTLHIILESRCPFVSSRNYSGEQFFSSPSPSPSSTSSSPSSFRRRDKWFNLALKDCPAAFENIDFWRQSNLEPMIVDVLLVKRRSQWDPLTWSPTRSLVRNLSGKESNSYDLESDGFRSEKKSEKIIERWIIQYESKQGGGAPGSRRSTCTRSHVLYRKSTLLLRSLYAMLRLLPAYKLFRDLTSSAQIHSVNLAHRVSSFAEPFTSREDADMQSFVFTPVGTSCGKLCLSVLYCSSVLDVSSEPSTPISPHFIPEYVGSPMAEPLKRLPSIPLSQGSPSSGLFAGRRSQSCDLHRESPHSVNPTPSPTYSEPHALTLTKKQHSNCLTPASLPRHLHYESEVGMENPVSGECWACPALSPSLSISKSACTPGSHISNGLLQCTSNPGSIPPIMVSSIHLLLNNQMLPPTSPTKTCKTIVCKQHTWTTDGQISSRIDKDDWEKLQGLKPSSNGSQSKSISRSSSQVSIHGYFEDSRFSGAFVLDDNDIIHRGSRPKSSDEPRYTSRPQEPDGLFPSKKWQVGALVHMLQKAPPLCKEISVPPHFQRSSHVDVNEYRSSEPGMQRTASLNACTSYKTTGVALNELHEYRAVKEKLLKQGKMFHA